MNKQEFLNSLKSKLKKLKKEERNKYIEYYDEIISDIVESGVSEDAAIERQGSIDQIAKDILANTNPANIKIRDLRGIVLSLVSLIMLFCCMATILFIQFDEMNITTSIGVIGGADGPTSVFIAGRIGTPWGLYIATAVVVITTITYYVRKYRK